MKLNQMGGSRTDTIVKLILVFFISLLSFSVGTFVGKQFSDSQHRLATLEEEYNKDSHEGREVASVSGDSMEVEPAEILSNEDVAKLAEEFVQEKPVIRDVANTPIPSAPAEVAPEMKAEPVVQAQPVVEPKVELRAIKKEIKRIATQSPEIAADKVANNQAPLEAVKAPEVKKAPLLPDTVAGDVKGKYTIQVSSHQSEVEAKTRVEELNGKGFVANYIPAAVDGKTWYRVGVGTFANVKSAKDYLEKIKETPGFKGAIVRQIVQ